MGSVLLAPSARAASSTWLNNGTTDGSWLTSTNWVGGVIPGSNSTLTNADTATFNTAVGTFGTSGSPVLIDTNRNIRSLTFNATAGNYFIGTTGGNKLLLTSGGAITFGTAIAGTGVAININAPLEIQNASGTGAGSYTFAYSGTNGTGAGSGSLAFGGAISGVATSGNTTTLNLGGTTVGNDTTHTHTISGNISNGAAGGKLELKKPVPILRLGFFPATIRLQEM